MVQTCTSLTPSVLLSTLLGEAIELFRATNEVLDLDPESSASLPAEIVSSSCCLADPSVLAWDARRSLWNGFMLGGALIAGPVTFSWSAFAIFLALSAVTLCAGHSVGFHRRLIHRSFDCPLWLERVLVWAGTLVGMSGPLWMIRTHDLRDWAQRQPACHDYLSHRRPMPVDG